MNVATNEDAGDFNITLRTIDADGDFISYVVTSSNPEIASVSVVDGELVVTQLPNANGLVNIEVNATAGGETISQSFDINITSVNDPVTVTSAISDLIVYKNFVDKNITLGIEDVDNADLTYTLNYDNTVVNVSIEGKQLTISSIVGASGQTDVNITAADAETNATLGFNIQVLSFEDGDSGEEQGEVAITEENGTKTLTVTVPEDNLLVEMVEHSDTTVSHKVVIGDKVTSAVSNLVNSMVELIADGVRTRYEEEVNALVEVIATVLGQAIHRVTVDGEVTEALFESPGTTTVIDRDGEGNVEVVSTFNTADRNITVTAKADGSSELVVVRDGNTTKVISQLKGTKTVVRATGDIETVAGAYDDLNGYFIKAKAVISANDQSEVTFVKVNQSDETDVSVLAHVLSDNSLLAAGSEVNVFERDTTLYIQVRVKLDNNLVIE